MILEEDSSTAYDNLNKIEYDVNINSYHINTHSITFGQIEKQIYEVLKLDILTLFIAPLDIGMRDGISTHSGPHFLYLKYQTL